MSSSVPRGALGHAAFGTSLRASSPREPWVPNGPPPPRTREGGRCLVDCSGSRRAEGCRVSRLRVPRATSREAPCPGHRRTAGPGARRFRPGAEPGRQDRAVDVDVLRQRASRLVFTTSPVRSHRACGAVARSHLGQYPTGNGAQIRLSRSALGPSGLDGRARSNTPAPWAAAVSSAGSASRSRGTG